MSRPSSVAFLFLFLLAAPMSAALAADAALDCPPPVLAALGRELKVAHFAVGQDNFGKDPAGVLVAATCKRMPDDPRLTLAAATQVNGGSLRFDTAPYELAPGVRAFGLDIFSEDPSCGEGGTGPVRTLYVRAGRTLRPVLEGLAVDQWWYLRGNQPRCSGPGEFGLDVTTGLPHGCAGVGSGARRSLFVSQGRFIRPVLQDLPMSEWALIQRGKSACTDSSAPDLTITENFTATLGLAPTSTRGYRDLVVTGMAARDDGRVDERPPFRALLKWDGRVYSLVEQQQAWTAWRQ
jgi:hypothetical protein